MDVIGVEGLVVSVVFLMKSRAGSGLPVGPRQVLEECDRVYRCRSLSLHPELIP